MKTLTEIKNNYAKEQGYEDWEDLVGQSSDYVDDHWTEICIRAQKAALEKAAERGRLVPSQGIGFIDFSKQLLDKKSITNPENLIR